MGGSGDRCACLICKRYHQTSTRHHAVVTGKEAQLMDPTAWRCSLNTLQTAFKLTPLAAACRTRRQDAIFDRETIHKQSERDLKAEAATSSFPLPFFPRGEKKKTTEESISWPNCLVPTFGWPWHGTVGGAGDVTSFCSISFIVIY